MGLVGERIFHTINCGLKDTSHEHSLLLWTLVKIDTWLIFTDVAQVKKQAKPSQTKQKQHKAKQNKAKQNKP